MTCFVVRLSDFCVYVGDMLFIMFSCGRISGDKWSLNITMVTTLCWYTSSIPINYNYTIILINTWKYIKFIKICEILQMQR